MDMKILRSLDKGMQRKILASTAVVAALAAALVLLGCNAGKGAPGAQLPGSETNPGVQFPGTEIPGSQTPATGGIVFPTGVGEEYSPVHEVSEAEQSVLGKDYIAVSPSGTYVEGDSVSIVATGGSTAWALYSVAGLTTQRPVKLEFDVAATTTLPSGEGDELPLEYWVGIANYSEYNWEWRGPYTIPRQATLHTEEIRSRYVSRNYGLHFVVVCHSTSEDNSGVKLNATTITTRDVEDELYLHTIPHAPLPTGFTPNPSYREARLDWEHFVDVHDPESEANSYDVMRRLNDTGQEVVLNTVAAPGTTFTEPDDNLPEVPWPVDGHEASYFISAQNDSGTTSNQNFGTMQHRDGVIITTWSEWDNQKVWSQDIDSEGNILIAGTNELNRSFLLKFSPDANLLWTKAWIGGEFDEAYVATSSNDEIFVKTDYSGMNLQKFSSSGSSIFQTSWPNGSTMEQAGSIAVDNSDNVYVLGAIDMGGQHPVILKYSESGELQWGSELVNLSAGAQYVGDIILDNNDEPVITGDWGNSGDVNFTFFIDGNGDLKQKVEYKMNRELDRSQNMGMDIDGNLYLTGEAGTLLKLDSAGEFLWCTEIPGSKFYGITIDDEGDVFITGIMGSDLLLSKFSSDGNLLKNLFWSPTGFDRAEGHNISIGLHGDIVISGVSDSYIGTWNSPSLEDNSLSPDFIGYVGSWSEPISREEGQPGFTYSSPSGNVDSSEEGQKVLLMIIPADELENM